MFKNYEVTYKQKYSQLYVNFITIIIGNVQNGNVKKYLCDSKFERCVKRTLFIVQTL